MMHLGWTPVRAITFQTVISVTELMTINHFELRKVQAGKVNNGKCIKKCKNADIMFIDVKSLIGIAVLISVHFLCFVCILFWVESTNAPVDVMTVLTFWECRQHTGPKEPCLGMSFTVVISDWGTIFCTGNHDFTLECKKSAAIQLFDAFCVMETVDARLHDYHSIV